MSLNFLLQATRVLHVGNYDEDELEMIYNFFISVDNEILNDYYNRCTILSYNNDLELYLWKFSNPLSSLKLEKGENRKLRSLQLKK